MNTNIENIYRLSPLQTGMLFHSLGDDGTVRPYTVQMVEEYTGPFNETAFRAAWQRVVDRHAVLRTGFMWENVSEPVQVVQRRARLPFTVHDWRDVAEERRQVRLDRFIADDWERGFDLSAAPLLRVTVIRMTDDRRVVVWSFHHLLLDGWSVQLVVADLYRFYRAELTGEEPDLPAPVPYAKHAEFLAGKSRREAERFWRKHLSGVTAPTVLGDTAPTGRVGVGVTQFDADTELSDAVTRFAKTHHLTVNTVVQGAWGLLLNQYSRQPSVIFGSTVAGRDPSLPGVESIVGLLINTLPVRVDVDGDATVAQWLQELQVQQAESRQYEHSALVDVQRWSDMSRGEPLFESILVFENYPSSDKGGGLPDGLRRRLLHCEERTGYPMTVVAWSGGGFGAKFVYDESRFEPEMVARVARHFENLVRAMVTGPDARLRDLDMLDRTERVELVSGWNSEVAEFDSGLTIHELVERRVGLSPGAVAVRHGSVEWSFAELNARANALAGRLRELGAGPGVLVGVCLEHSPDAVASLLAVLKSGAAFVPLDPSYPSARLGFMLEDTAAPVLITTSGISAGLPEHGAAVVALDAEWDGIRSAYSGEDVSPSVSSPQDLAYIIYTSGSTGKPKGVMLEHYGVVNYLDWCAKAYPAVEGAVGTFLYSSITFDLTITALFLPLIQGLPVEVPVVDADTTAFQATAEELLTGRPVSFIKATPSHLEMLATLAEQTDSRLAIHSVVAGGEELTSALARRLFDISAVPLTITNEYGATEGSVANVMSMTTVDSELSRPGVSVGRAVQNTRVYVVDEFDRPVPVGVPGEALLGGICVARGYHNRPELSAARFTVDPFDADARVYRTGDLVRWLPGGELEFIGRIDNQVKLRGYRIELGEIEAALLSQPGVLAASVIVREDQPGDKRLTGYYVGSADPGALRAGLGERLPDYMVPVHVMALPELPLTPNGKVDTKALPAPAEDRPDRAGGYVEPSTHTERTVAQVWSTVLGVARVGAADDFFALGGHSIVAITVAARLTAAGCAATVQQVMRNPVLRDLAAALDLPTGAATTQLTLRLSGDDAAQRPKLFCIHPGGGSVHAYRTLAERLGSMFEVHGVQAAGVDGVEPPITGVKAMAERYWTEIRAVQPEGPYHLLGWSTGGVIVHEMAAMRPAEVAHAVLLEPAVTGPSERARFAGHARAREAADELWRRGRSTTGAERARIEERLRRLAVEADIDPDAMDLDQWLPFAVLAAELRSLETYVPGESDAKVSLVVGGDYRSPDRVPNAGGGDFDGYTRHWRRLYPAGLAVTEVSATHMAMVSDPSSVEALTALLAGEPVLA